MGHNISATKDFLHAKKNYNKRLHKIPINDILIIVKEDMRWKRKEMLKH